MTTQRTLRVLLALLSVVQVTLAQTGTDLKLLHDELFNKRSYQKDIAPYASLNDPIIVAVAFHLHGINNLDEVDEKLATTAHLQLEWSDAFLSWDRRDFSGISNLYMPQSAVWKPDVSLHNGFSKLKELGDDVILVNINYRGRIEWNPLEVFETKCDIDIVKFPFDQQICMLIFKMWTALPKDVKFGLKDPALNTESHDTNGVWDLRSSRVELDKGNFIVYLTLDRRPEYYLLTLICPIILLSLLDIFTFVIPVGSGEKIGYSMTVYLAFSVFLTIASSSLPVNSRTTSYLSVYLISLLVKGTTIVIVTAAQVRLHHRQNSLDLPPSLRRVIKISRRMHLCSSRRVKPNSDNVTKQTSFTNEKSDNSVRSSPHFIAVKGCTDPRPPSNVSSDHEDDEDEIYTWTDFSAILDVFFFCFFSTVAVVLAIAFFTALL